MLKAVEPSGGILFEEKQRFPRWLSFLIIGICVFSLVLTLVVSFVVSDEKQDAWIGLVIALPTQVLVIYLLQKLQLEKIVTTNGLYYRWKPWHRKYRVLEKDGIASMEERNGPPMNYGFGWFPGYGRFHNASDGKGLQLYLVNGKKIYFSTNDIAFFKKAVQQLISSTVKPRFSEF